MQITGWIDEGLNEKAYIVPGLGDFGERRYGVRALVGRQTLTRPAALSGIASKRDYRRGSGLWGEERKHYVQYHKRRIG